MPVGSGARAAGMGNAFVAVADDATAASWNPAGLVNLELPEISVVGSLMHQQDIFDKGVKGIASYDGGADSTTSANLNYLSGVLPFELLNRHIVASLNYQRKLDFNKNADFTYRKQFTNEADQNIDDSIQVDFSQQGGLSTLTPALAIQIHPLVSIGCAFNYWMDEIGSGYSWRLETELHRWESYDDPPETFYHYFNNRETFSNFDGMNWTAGLLLGPFHGFSFGAVYNTSFTADLDWHQRFLSRSDDDVHDPIYQDRVLEMKMPESWGVGLSYQYSDNLVVTVDYTRIEWDSFVLRDDTGGETNIMGEPADSNNIDASNIVRAGLEYLLFFEKFIVPLRLGAFYDPQPGSRHPRDFFGFALGSGFVYRFFCIDFAYQLRQAFGDEENNLFDILGEGGLTGMEENLNQHLFLFSAIMRF